MGEREVVFVDANIFLEVFLRDQNAERCKSFLRNLEENEVSAVTSDFVAYTCLIQIEYKLKSPKIMKDFLIAMDNFQIEIVRPLFYETFGAVEIGERHKLDFDDGLIISCMKSNGITKLISLDKHFDIVQEIKRVEP